MKTACAILVVTLASASAFTPPMMATRAVGKSKVKAKAVVKPKVVEKKINQPKSIFFSTKAAVVKPKVVAKAKVVGKAKVVAKPKVKAKAKVVAKPKVVAKKIVKPKANLFSKKVAAKKVVAAPVGSDGFEYPMWNTAGIKFNISGGGKAPQGGLPRADFSDPKLQIQRDPAFYAAAAATRSIKTVEYKYDDGLTLLERKQANQGLAAFLSGSARSQKDTSTIREVAGEEFAFGLSADRFQLLFIAVFGVFTLIGCLSGTAPL